jgi:hypothetical protein
MLSGVAAYTLSRHGVHIGSLKKKLGNIMFKNELFIATFNSLINSKSVQLIYR